MCRKWITEDGRPLTERGLSQIDPDCVVAHYDDSPDVAVWIIAQGSGLVLDFRSRAQVFAKPFDFSKL
jgi:hypothetical protein